MPVLLGLSLLIGLILLANMVAIRGDQNLHRVFHGILFLLNVPVLLIGLLLMVTPAAAFEEIMAGIGNGPTNSAATGASLLFMGMWAMAVTLAPTRQLLARLIPLQPASPVHTLALVMSGYLIGNSLINLSQDGLDGLAETATPATIATIVASQLLFVLIAVFGIGLGVRRDGRQLLQRLGLEWPTAGQLWAGLGWILILVVLQSIAGAIWMLLDPERAELLENINTLLLQDIDSLWKWFVLAASAGIGEEILFRGALQPVLGIGFTSLLFAFAHVQYGFTFISFFVFLMGIVFGIIRQRHNTTTAIFVHFGYDFVLGILALLAAYLEQSAG